MARTSIRNFLTAFRHVGVDATAEGPDVSQDVQMVYVVDDLRQTSYIQGGSGTIEAAVAVENAIISIECRVPRGMEIEQITIEDAVAGFGDQIECWTSATEPTITGVANLVTALRTTGLAGQPAAPLSIARVGTIATGAIPASAFRYNGQQGFTPRFFINQGQFFNAAAAEANVLKNVAIRWRELRLFPSP